MPEPPDRPAIADSPISVVLPAHNAEAELEQALHGWVMYLDSLDRDYEICVVNDGSKDHTAQLAEALAGRYPRMRVIHHSTQSGVGAALRTGLAAARFPLFCYAECSTGYQPADLAKMLELIDHVDLVCGCREWKTSRPRRSWKATLFGWLVRLVFGVHLKDVECSFKLFRRSIFGRIPIQSDGPFVHAEIVAKANFLGCLITEVPVSCLAPSRPLVPPSSSHRQWREALQILRHPDFGARSLLEKSLQ